MSQPLPNATPTASRRRTKRNVNDKPTTAKRCAKREPTETLKQPDVDPTESTRQVHHDRPHGKSTENPTEKNSTEKSDARKIQRKNPTEKSNGKPDGKAQRIHATEFSSGKTWSYRVHLSPASSHPPPFNKRWGKQLANIHRFSPKRKRHKARTKKGRQQKKRRERGMRKRTSECDDEEERRRRGEETSYVTPLTAPHTRPPNQALIFPSSRCSSRLARGQGKEE